MQLKRLVVFGTLATHSKWSDIAPMVFHGRLLRLTVHVIQGTASNGRAWCLGKFEVELLSGKLEVELLSRGRGIKISR